MYIVHVFLVIDNNTTASTQQLTSDMIRG